MITAMIVEDSRLARLELKEQLNGISEINLVGEADNVEAAIALYDEQKPQLVFLDIDLPDGSGFDFLTALPQAPIVIFITAFQEFALQAFEHGAVDYLLKPIRQTRLAQAIERVKDSAEAQVANDDMLQLDSQFFVKDNQACHLVTLSHVQRFEAMGNYTRVYFDDKKPMVYRTLSQIEQRLPEAAFFRVSRQNIVQLSKICGMEPCSSGSLVLTLENGDQVEVSRRQASLFKQRFAL